MVDKIPNIQGPNKDVGYKRPPIGRRFQPGQSGNPKGRPPKNISILTKVKELLEQDAGKGKTNAQLIAEALIELAKDKGAKGNVPVLVELLNRIEGRVPYALDHSLQKSEALEELLLKLRGK